jgi:hypothetical protein
MVTVGILGAGCTAILGDFSVNPAGSGPDSGGDVIGGGDDGPDSTKDAASDDGAGGGLKCDFVPTSFRKITDLKGHDAGDQRFDSVSIVSINDSAVRVFPRTSGATSDTLTIFTFRTDKPADNPNVSTMPGARFNEVRHRIAPGGTGEVAVLTGINGSTNFNVYSMPDNDTGGGLASPIALMTTPPPNGSQERATIFPIGLHDYWSLVEYQNGGPQFIVGTVRATGFPGALVTSAASGPNPFSTDFINLLAIGSDMFAFNAGDVGGGGELEQWKFPTTPSASSTGVSRKGIGTDLLPVAAIPASGGTGVELCVGKIAFDPSHTTITGIDLSTGVVPNANYFTFTFADLKHALTLNDQDTFSFGPKSALAAYPGHLGFLGKGALASSSGLNFTIIDTVNSSIQYSAVGTGKNLLQGNNRIDSLAMDYAPASFGTSFAFDVVWVEHVYEDAGPDYDVLYYNRLQCDKL